MDSLGKMVRTAGKDPLLGHVDSSISRDFFVLRGVRSPPDFRRDS